MSAQLDKMAIARTALLLGIVLLLDCPVPSLAGCNWESNGDGTYSCDTTRNTYWYGSCSDKPSDCWKTVYSTYGYGEYCCAPSEGDCCKDSENLATGIIVGIVVAVVVAIGGCLACCFCCPSCPGYQHRNPPQPATAGAIVMQPGVVTVPAGGVPMQTGAMPMQAQPNPGYAGQAIQM